MSALISLKITIEDKFNYLLYGDQICHNLAELSAFCGKRYQDLQKTVDGYRYFWVDDENDEIRISTDEDYFSFLHAMANSKARLYVVGKQTTPSADSSVEKEEQSEVNAAAPLQNGGKDLPTHPYVVCDVCDGNIVGHRYKCLTCHDFDICMTCEAKYRHKDHLMMRIPRPDMVNRSQTTVSRLFEKLRLYATRIADNLPEEREDDPARILSFRLGTSPGTKREHARGSQRGSKHHGEDRRSGEPSKPSRASKSGGERKQSAADDEKKDFLKHHRIETCLGKCHKDFMQFYMNLDPTATSPTGPAPADCISIANAAAAAAAAAAAKATAAATSAAMAATTSNFAANAATGEGAVPQSEQQPSRHHPRSRAYLKEMLKLRAQQRENANNTENQSPNEQQQSGQQQQQQQSGQQQQQQQQQSGQQQQQQPAVTLPFLPFVNLGWPTPEKLMVASENVSKLLDPLGLSFEIRHKAAAQSPTSYGREGAQARDDCTPSTSAPSVPTVQKEEARATTEEANESKNAQSQTKPTAEESTSNQVETEAIKSTAAQQQQQGHPPKEKVDALLESDAVSTKQQEVEEEHELEDGNVSQTSSISSASLLSEDDQDLIDVAEDVAKSTSPSKPSSSTEKTWTLVDIPHDEDDEKVANAPLDAIAKLIETASSASSKAPAKEEKQKEEPKKTSSPNPSASQGMDFENYSKILAEHLAGSIRGVEEDKQQPTTSTATEEKVVLPTPPNSGPSSASSSSSSSSAGKSGKASRKSSGGSASSQQKDFTIYSHRPHVNHAIHTMMTMGFSNHNGWLTQLLESLNGDIPKALDLLLQHRH